MGFGLVFCINGKHGQGTHSTKIGADKSAKNTPNAIHPKCDSLQMPKKLSAQAQKFGMKKGFIRRP